VSNHKRLGRLIRQNLGKKSVGIALPKGVTATKVFPSDSLTFAEFAKLLIALFCRHPRRILEKIQQSGEKGIEEIVADLCAQTMITCEAASGGSPGTRVWRGTIGEVLATAYVIGFTEYSVPVLKLRLAPNRRVAMHGDDLLGFKIDPHGEPLALLVVEAKNWQSVGNAIREANSTLLKVKGSSPTLLDFVINALDTEGRTTEAKLVERFLDEYNYKYYTNYLAFVVADKKKWKDDLCLSVGKDPATPLELAALIVADSGTFHDSLTGIDQPDEPDSPKEPSTEIDDLADVQRLLENPNFRNEHSRLASAALVSSP